METSCLATSWARKAGTCEDGLTWLQDYQASLYNQLLIQILIILPTPPTPTTSQHGLPHDDRDQLPRHQQHQSGRRGETAEAVAERPPATRETLTAGDHSGGHSLHQDAQTYSQLLKTIQSTIKHSTKYSSST